MHENAPLSFSSKWKYMNSRGGPALLLGMRARQARQADITTELLDLVTGAEALRTDLHR
jgi:hypothetical protein